MQLCSTHVHNIYAGQCKYCEEENLSFKDMLLKSHGMETKKEERVDMQKKLEEFEEVSTEAQKLMNQLPLPRCVLSNDPKEDKIYEMKCHQEFRALCLKIAHDEQERNKISGVCGSIPNLIGRASRLYTYITKGE